MLQPGHAMASVALRSVSKSFGNVPVVADVNLEIADGELVVFVGPSGCGKSTLLRLIAGLVAVSAGDIAIDGEVVTDVPASKRGIAFVFQSYALYPHMNIARNIGFALETVGLSKEAIRAKVADVAAMLKIDHLLLRRPRELSGGQRQRVAIGRALVRQPDVFLFDEPLSNLDSDLRIEMRMEIAKLHATLSATMIYVTHDQVEAMTLADRIVVLNKGRIEQVGTPQQLYHAPENRFVAGFIGSPRMNFLAVSAAGSRLDGPGNLSLDVALADPSATTAEIGVRPEALTIMGAGQGKIRGVLERVEDLGHEHLAYVRIEPDTIWTVRVAGTPGKASIGAAVGLRWRSEDLFLFDGEGRRLDHSESHERSAAANGALT
jgi:multiple sugar transport system ATP-binding protein